MKKGLFFLLFMVAFIFKGFSQSTPADSTEMYAYIDSVLAEARGPIKRTDFFNLMTTFNSYMALQGVNGIAIINAGDTASMLTPYISRNDTAAAFIPFIERSDTASMLASYIQRSDTAAMLTSYINRADTAAAFAPFIERSDTASMLTPYISRNDTASAFAPFIERGDTASMLNSYTRRAELEDTALAIRNDLTAVIGSKTDTTEFNALELTYNPNSQPILNKHYRKVDKQTIYIEEINNAAQGVSRLLNTTLSSSRNAYQDAEVVWIADNSDSAVTYSNKGANFTLSRNGKIYGKNNEGDWFEWLSYYPNIDFQENKQKAGLRLFSYIDYGFYRSRVEADTATLYSIDSCTQNKIEYNVSNSSITLIPDGAKAGSLYSIFPNDGSGDFSVTRATTATRINEDGLIESVGVNVPRIDYAGGGCPSLLLEPQRTNLFLNSQTGATQNVTVANTTQYTVSFSGTGTITFTGGYVGSLVGTGSTARDRVSVTFTTTSTSVVCTITGTVDYVNFEAGNYATSWIETTGSTVTRNADVINLNGVAALLGDSEGTLILKASLLDAVNDQYLALSDGTTANRIYFRLAGSYRMQMFEGGVQQSNLSFGSFNAGEVFTIAFRYAQNDIALFANGIKLDQDNSANIYSDGTLTDVRFTRGDGVGNFYGNIEEIMVFPTALTDTQLQTLTQ